MRHTPFVRTTDLRGTDPEGHRQRGEYGGPAGSLACSVGEGTTAVEFVWYRRLLP
jgi:hypothetical protein